MKKKNPPAGQSQDMTLLFYTLVSAQVVFMADGEIHALNRQTISSSPEQDFSAKHLLHIQNTVGFQVKNDLINSGKKFESLNDVIIMNLIPLGQMTHSTFWAGMGKTEEVSTEDAEAVSATVTPIRPV